MEINRFFAALRMTVIFLLIVLWRANAFAGEPLRISKVSIAPKTIDLSKKEKTTIHFETSHNAFLGITLRDENENLLNRYELGMRRAGIQTFIWDGRAKNGEYVSTDVVIYSIDGRTEDKHYVHYDPALETGGLELKDMKLTLDLKTGKIEYVLPKAGRARLRAGLLDGVLLKTINDWRPEEAGRHEFLWDGLDKSGEINLTKHPKLNLNLNVFSIPENSIIVKGIEISYQKPDQAFRSVKEGKHFHYPHARILCHEPHFQVRFPSIDTRGTKGVVKLKGKVPVSVELDQKDSEDLIRKRFEVIVYVDTEFLFEEEQAVSPATFYWDVSHLNPGYHLLTVNIMSYDDHVGTETVKVWVN